MYIHETRNNVIFQISLLNAQVSQSCSDFLWMLGKLHCKAFPVCWHLLEKLFHKTMRACLSFPCDCLFNCRLVAVQHLTPPKCLFNNICSPIPSNFYVNLNYKRSPRITYYLKRTKHVYNKLPSTFILTANFTAD